MARYKFVSKMFAGRQNVLELGCGDAFNAPILRPRLRDPNDEMVLEAAAIVTFNKRDFGVVPLQFRVAVLTPREALERTGP